MPHTFLNIGNTAEFVGQTPWSARVPLDPLFARRVRPFDNVKGRRGRRPRTRGSAPQFLQVFGHGKSTWHYAEACATWSVMPFYYARLYSKGLAMQGEEPRISGLFLIRESHSHTMQEFRVRPRHRRGAYLEHVQLTLWLGTVAPAIG
jgi:hypothetical protein